ncbi:MAG: lysylphosphatidylglycerol synthase domain-containing protein, partial [Candidatus Hodarchaeota archaeon]
MQVESIRAAAIPLSKVLVGLALISLILLRMDAHQLRHLLQSGNYVFLTIALAFFALSNIIGIARLHALIRNLSVKIYDTTRVFLVSLFVGNFLPTSIGGDFYRIFYIKNKSNWQTAVTLVTLERIFGLVVLMVMGLTVLLADFAVLK